MEQFNDEYLNPDYIVTEKVKETRLIICTKCSSFQASLCSECNCLVGMIVSYSFKSCPLNKW